MKTLNVQICIQAAERSFAETKQYKLLLRLHLYLCFYDDQKLMRFLQEDSKFCLICHLQKSIIQSMNDCIFASSKYYKQAYASALSICEPLGYNFLSKKQQAQFKKQSGALIRKVLFDKPLIKTLSTKRTLLQKVSQHLLVSDSKRKNTYLSATPLSIINKTSSDIVEQLSTKFLSSFGASIKETLNLVNTFHTINDDVIFSIGDYALKTFFVFYDGSNVKGAQHIVGVFQNQLIEYDVKVILSNPNTQAELSENGMKDKIQKIEFDHQSDIKSKLKIDEYVEAIWQKGTSIDIMYSGLHFFIGDCSAGVSTHDILKEQIDNLKYLQYYVYLLSAGVLGNGQNAILKVRGTIRHKTVDYIFLLKLIFTKVTIVKPAFSNFLESQKYLICQGYVAENGVEVHKFLSQNFNLLAQHGEQKLLVNPQLIFREEFLADNTKNFNDSLIVKGIKDTVEIFMKNSNLQIYPPRGPLIQKLNSYNDSGIFANIIKEIEQNIPNEEEIKNEGLQEKNVQNKNDNRDLNKQQGTAPPQIEEKQASFDIFAFMKAKQQVQPVEKPVQKVKKPKIQDDQTIEKELQLRYKQQEKIREEKKKQKKQKQKKQKQQIKEQDPYEYASRFGYAEG